MKKLLTAVLLCAAALAPTLSQAQQYRLSDYYLAADYGLIDSSGPGLYTSPGSLTVALGASLTPNVGLEAGLTMVGSTTATNLPGWGTVHYTQHIATAQVVGKLPVNNIVTLFGKLGVSAHNFEVYGPPDDIVFGVGAQFQLSREFSVRAQYENLGRTRIPSTNVHADLSRLSVGAAYHF